jgi:3-hydroxyisobutyrate dehydrogenase-like beta-hydroxyacid dehydrogenase
MAGALYFDMNSVAPDTKRAAALAVEAAGGRYVDVAVMAPVEPARLAVPLLVSGPHADDGAAALSEFGFSNVRVLPGDIGRASSVKMIRSVMVKGIEALTAEMMLAGEAAGVSGDVLASLGGDWSSKAAYNIERMTTHGLRRAAEMEEVAKTLVALGIDPVMTRGTVQRQREMAA